MIDWLNGMKSEIKRVYVEPATGLMLELFMNRFQRSIEDLEVQDRYIKCEEINYKRLHFKIKNSFSSYSAWYTLDFLFSLGCEQIEAFFTNFSGKELNVFLRSWQEGKTNQKLNRIKISTCRNEIMSHVLKDCEAELIDPRTTKLKFQDPIDLDIWIHGGIHFRRNDGRLAVIDINYEASEETKEEVSEKHIQKYLREREMWDSGRHSVACGFHICFF
uniref:FBA_2 domain-containing protein n=1 Tax=Caenorhabditis tropicalis TaxID=1561998 RepID=A0A1I7U1A9_9PELO